MRDKVDLRGKAAEVIYDEERLRILDRLRRIAIEILESLKECGIEGYAYGSIARGDVDKESDVDIAIIHDIPTNILRLCIEKKWRIYRGEIIMATPTRTPILYLYLDIEGRISISKHLWKPSTTEYEFYKFGGMASLDQLLLGQRVPGVNKRLRLIIPTERGHIERDVIGHEAEVARILGISVETVAERVRVLTRRDRLGRTGVFFKAIFDGDSSIEEVIRGICKSRAGMKIARIFEEHSLC
ncbi:MAG TPA: nucleotidyltransferase domain-containing protein [Sulfolobales archaeon]|nr:nucleotidyltransferase domain-containing protein [Sulfolobales archaeon]